MQEEIQGPERKSQEDKGDQNNKETNNEISQASKRQKASVGMLIEKKGSLSSRESPNSNTKINGPMNEENPQTQEHPDIKGEHMTQKEGESLGETSVVPVVVDPTQEGPQEIFMVEKIRGKKKAHGQLLYLVKWEGYPETDNTWEPAQNLMSCGGLIDDFEINESLKQKSKKRGKKSGSTPGDEYVPEEKGPESQTSSSWAQEAIKSGKLTGEASSSTDRVTKNRQKSQKKSLKLAPKTSPMGQETNTIEEKPTIDPKEALKNFCRIKNKQMQVDDVTDLTAVKIINHKCLAPLEGNLIEKLIFQVEWAHIGDDSNQKRLVTFETREKVKKEFANLLVDYYEDYLKFASK